VIGRNSWLGIFGLHAIFKKKDCDMIATMFATGSRVVFAAVLSGVCATAAQAADVQELYDALRLDGIADIIHQEGIEQIDVYAENYVGPRSASQFAQQAQEIFARDDIQSTLMNGLETLDPDHMAAALDYFTSAQGALFAELETTARVAISDDEVEEQAKAMAAQARDSDRARIALLERSIEVLEMVEFNIQAAQESQYSFLIELAQAEVIDFSQGEILALIAEDQGELTEMVQEWLLAFTYMAYSPVSDDELQGYIDFQSSDPGQALNQALFDAFRVMDVEQSQKMGRLVASFMAAQEL
jgi:hypothetical protein